MSNPSWRNLPNPSQIRDNRGPTFRVRTLSGSRCSGNCLFPLLSPIRSDHLPLLESMTPRLLNKRYKAGRHAVKPRPASGKLQRLIRNGEVRRPYPAKPCILTPTCKNGSPLLPGHFRLISSARQLPVRRLNNRLRLL